VLSNTRKDLDEDLHIKRKKYYRLVPSTTRKHEDVLKGFLAALEELETDDLISKTRYEYELNAAGVPSKKILKQVCKKPNRTNPRSLKSGLIVTCKSFVNQSANGYLGVFYGYSAEEAEQGGASRGEGGGGRGSGVTAKAYNRGGLCRFRNTKVMTLSIPSRITCRIVKQVHVP
jgi:hypothetical protein